MAVLGSGNQPGIDKWPGVVTPVVLRHVTTAAEEDGGIVVVLRSQRKHRDTTGGRIDSDDTTRHVGKASLAEGCRVPQHGGNVGLDEHLARGHHEGVGVRVETRSIDHELHLLGGAFRGEELDSGFGGTSFGCWVGVGVIPVDVTTVDETTDQSNCTIGEGFSSRVPTRLLHLQHIGIFPPTALRIGNEIVVGSSTRVDDTNGAGAVVILEGRVILGRGTAWVWNRTELSTGTDSAVATKGGEGTIGKMHP